METSHETKIGYEDGKYICKVCREVLTKILGATNARLEYSYKIENGAMDTEYTIDWDIPEVVVHMKCGSCESIIGSFDDNIAERILRNNNEEDPEPDPDILDEIGD